MALPVEARAELLPGPSHWGTMQWALVTFGGQPKELLFQNDRQKGMPPLACAARMSFWRGFR
jgi:hypothetical protein